MKHIQQVKIVVNPLIATPFPWGRKFLTFQPQLSVSTCIYFSLFSLYCAVPQKYPYPPGGRSLEIPRGGGSYNSKF